MTFTEAIPRSVMNRATQRAIEPPPYPPPRAGEGREGAVARTILILCLGASIFRAPSLLPPRAGEGREEAWRKYGR